MSQRALRVFLVDDEHDIVYVLKKGMQLKGFKVDDFTDPLQASQQFLPNYYDAVITDIRMPQMTGFDLYQKIREKDEAVRVYFMSAYEPYQDTIKEKFSDNGLVSFIRKPITYTILIRMLQKDIDQAADGQAKD